MSHKFEAPGKTKVAFCTRCGHVPLSNGISKLVTKLGCNYENDSRYKAWVSGGRKPLEVVT